MKEALRRNLAKLVRRLLIANSHPMALGNDALLIVAPHADDETLGCGGLIAAQVSRGAPVHVVFVSDSAAAGWSMAAERPARAQQRQAEALAALAALGVPPGQVLFLHAPDGELDRLDLATHRRTVDTLASALNRVRPNHLFLPMLNEGSTEHDGAHWIALEALRCTSLAPHVWEYPIWAWWNPFRLVAQLSRHEENFSHDATSWIGSRERALNCHSSQISGSTEQLPVVLTDLASTSHEVFFRRQTPTP